MYLEQQGESSMIRLSRVKLDYSDFVNETSPWNFEFDRISKPSI